MGKAAARGVLLQYENPTGTFVTVPGLGDFDFSLGQAEVYEEDSHSVTGGSVHKKTGKLTNQPFTVPIEQWDGKSTEHGFLATSLASSEAINLKITCKDTAVYTFSALVTDVAVSNPKGSSVGGSVTFQPTGDIVKA